MLANDANDAHDDANDANDDATETVHGIERRGDRMSMIRKGYNGATIVLNTREVQSMLSILLFARMGEISGTGRLDALERDACWRT